MLLGENHLLELLDEVYTAQKVDFKDLLVNAEVGVQGPFALLDAGVEHEEVDAEVV